MWECQRGCNAICGAEMRSVWEEGVCVCVDVVVVVAVDVGLINKKVHLSNQSIIISGLPDYSFSLILEFLFCFFFCYHGIFCKR